MNSLKISGLVLTLSSLLLIPLVSKAGEATLTGYGEVLAPPEFVGLSIHVTSECFRSAKDVSVTNDQVASQVLDILRSVAQPSRGDEVRASGGYVQRYTGYNPQTEKNICINSFRKINTITFKTKSVEDFPELFADLQDRLYALGMESAPTRLEDPSSYLEIGEPLPGISSTLRQTYERKALTLALQDAKEKFQSTLLLAGIAKYKIINYSENAILPRNDMDEVRRSVAASPRAPVELGSLTITKFLNVRFEYTGGELNIPF